MTEQPQPAPEFDASRYLRTIKVRGGGEAQYLPAAARILWARHDHPTAQIVTEIVLASENMARFKCTITLPTGAVATGHGQETASSFADFFEKAETVAVSRALAILGYGTEGAYDLEDRQPEQTGRASTGDRVRKTDPMHGSAASWFRRELPRRGMTLPQRFELWGDVVGVLDSAGHAVGEASDERGIDFAAVKAIVEALPLSKFPGAEVVPAAEQKPIQRQRAQRSGGGDE